MLHDKTVLRVQSATRQMWIYSREFERFCICINRLVKTSFWGSVGQERCGKIPSLQLAVEPLSWLQAAVVGHRPSLQQGGNRQFSANRKHSREHPQCHKAKPKILKAQLYYIKKLTACLYRSEKNLPSSPEHERSVLLAPWSFCATPARTSSSWSSLIAFKQHTPNLASASLSVHDAAAPEKLRATQYNHMIHSEVMLSLC